MKTCGRCGVLKPPDDFHLSTRYDGRQPWCKECRREYDKRYWASRKDLRLEQKRAWKNGMAAWARDLKVDKPCADCGDTFHPAAMTWDHLPGTNKLGDVGNMVRRAGKERILAEISKCELVCANCHAVRTFERRNGV